MKSKYMTIAASLLLLSTTMLRGADSTIIARVGDNEVRADDIRPFIEKLPVRDQLLLSKDPTAMNDFVRGIIVQQLVYKEALSKRWDQQPQIAVQLEKIRQQAITQTYIQSVSTPPADYPSATDLQAAYEALKKNNVLNVPKQYRLAQIYIACSKGSDKETEAKAQIKLDSVMKEIKAGDFSTAAKSQSDDVSSSQRGGELGFLAESQIQPEIKTAVASLSKGEVTEPIRLNDGWHIVKVLEIKEPYTASIDEVKGALVNELRSQRSQVLAKAYLGKMMQQNPLTINEIAAAKLFNSKGN